MAADVAYLTEVLGGRVVFAIDRTPGGHRIALYQLTRPEVAAHFAGRRDF